MDYLLEDLVILLNHRVDLNLLQYLRENKMRFNLCYWLLLPNCNAGSLSITVSKYLSSAQGGNGDGFICFKLSIESF
jgi:hypothetical protein